ncbi:hypothetical protein RQP46_001497 [Phenoliferia psychrophenolica]
MQGFAIHRQESDYVQAKARSSVQHWTYYLNSVALEGLDVSSFVPSSDSAVAGNTLPIIGVAASGGALRAMLVGGGILDALDNRNPDAVAAKTGGVLQLASYGVGASGGSWLVGSYALAGFPRFRGRFQPIRQRRPGQLTKMRVAELLDHVWNMADYFFQPTNGPHTQPSDVIAYIEDKAHAGAPISFIDVSTTLFSSIQSTSAFKNAEAPFPIILSTAAVNGSAVTLESPMYESTPFHFGTSVPASGGLSLPIEYLGTKLDGGTPSDTRSCMTGFENAGFLMASSGNYLGALVGAGWSVADVNAIFKTDGAYSDVLSSVSEDIYDNGRVVNPFVGMAAPGFANTADPELSLLDGGAGGENIPFWPLVAPSRAVDVIIAIDATDDADNYPNGQQIYNSYQKSLQPGYPRNFPVIPDPDSFVAQGLHKRPVFFGSACYAQPGDVTTPLIVYLPNYEVSSPTNTVTTKLSYTSEHAASFFSNSFGIATQSAGSATWASCLACALIDAQEQRNGNSRSRQCGACFNEYCYMGA